MQNESESSGNSVYLETNNHSPQSIFVAMDFLCGKNVHSIIQQKNVFFLGHVRYISAH